MLKAFLRDGVVYGTAKVLTAALALLSLPIYTRALAPGAYGVIDLLTAVAAVVHVTVALEIATGLSRFVNSPEAAGEHDKFASTALWFTIAAYSVFAVCITPFASRLSSYLFHTVAYAHVIRVATAVAWTTGIFYLVQNVLRFERRALRFATISICFSFTSFAVAVVLLLVFHAGLVALLIGQFVAGLGAAALGLWFLRDMIRLRFDRARCRQMLAFSIPLIPSGVGVMLCLYVDRYAVVHLLSITDLGVYAAAARIAAIVPVAVAGLQSAVIPLVFQRYKEPDAPRQLARIFRWFLALALPLVLFMGLFSAELVRLLLPAVYLPASRLVFLLSSSMLVANLYNFSPGLWIAKRTPWIAVISLAAGGINLGLDFLLIPHVGLLGAAVASLVGASAGAIAHFIFGQLFYPIPFPWSRIAVASALVVCGVLGRQAIIVGHVHLASPVSFILKVVLWIAVSGFVSLILLGIGEVKLAGGQVMARIENGWRIVRRAARAG